MPNLQSRLSGIDPEKYVKVPGSKQPLPGNLMPPPDAEVTRSPVMLASLPGIGSGPDAILRQFNGGRRVPKSRLLIPY